MRTPEVKRLASAVATQRMRLKKALANGASAERVARMSTKLEQTEVAYTLARSKALWDKLP